MTNRYYNSECLLNEGAQIDAWLKNRRLNYSSIEGCYPLFGERAKGCRVWDVDGNEYIDYTMGYGTIILGHADERVNQAVFNEIRNGTCFPGETVALMEEFNIFECKLRKINGSPYPCYVCIE